jgi:hypothetical protein
MGYGKGNPGRPIGTSKYPYQNDRDRELIVRYIKQGKENREISALIGWPETEVRDVRAMFFPTPGLAKDYLLANALKLAQRVVEEANVEESIDILSRPNIGVLEPVVKAQNQPRIGIITNINTSTLGGVMPSTSTYAIDVSPEPEPLCLPPNPVPFATPLLATRPTRNSGSPSTPKTVSPAPKRSSARPKTTKPKPSSKAPARSPESK